MKLPMAVIKANNQWDAYTAKYDLVVFDESIRDLYGDPMPGADNAPIVGNENGVLHAPLIVTLPYLFDSYLPAIVKE